MCAAVSLEVTAVQIAVAVKMGVPVGRILSQFKLVLAIVDKTNVRALRVWSRMFYAGLRIVSKLLVILVILQTSEYPDSDYVLILVRNIINLMTFLITSLTASL